MSFQPIFHTTSTRIAASAGTGKTYRLASRYISLLMLGADPDKIIALTFTKKAAGEFRNRILHALAEGACDIRDEKTGRNEMAARVWQTWSGLTQKADKTLADERNVPLLPATRAVVRRAAAEGLYPEELYAADKELQDYLQLPQATAATFAALLQKVVSSLSKLTLSTLDSFFNALVTGSSMELGVNNITALDPADEPVARRRAIDDYLEANAADEEKRALFLRLFAELTDGKGSRTVAVLEDELKSYLELYRAYPSVDAWGNDSYFAQACTEPFVSLTPAEEEEWTRKAARLNTLMSHADIAEFPYNVYGGLLWLCGRAEELRHKKPTKALEKWCAEAVPFATVLQSYPFALRLRDAYRERTAWSPDMEAWKEHTAALVQRMNGSETMVKAIGTAYNKIRNGKQDDKGDVPGLWAFLDRLEAVFAQESDLEAHLQLLQQIHELAQPLMAQLSAKIMADAKARTRSLYSLLRDYADTYEHRMTTTGEFSFSDISRKARLLMERLPQVAEGMQRGDFCREHLALRTGRQYRHWMLDEFQDTSDSQFATLAPVLEAIAEDAYQGEIRLSPEALGLVPDSLRPYLEEESFHVAEGSIFVVGDEKQGIYGFRTGETKAFEQLGSEEPWRTPIMPEALTKSYRSSPVIMGKDGFINTLFGKLAELEENDVGDRAVDLQPFAGHDTAKTFPGYVRMELVNRDAASSEEGESDAEYRNMIAILKDLTDAQSQPKNGMSVAILTRSNQEAESIVEVLNNDMPDLPVMLVKESLSAVTCPLGEMLHHFFRWLLHPAEGFSLGVLRASFMGALFRAGDSEEKTWLLCCRELEEKGYAGMLRKLEGMLSPQEREEHRLLLKTWMEAARAFDAEGASMETWVRHIAALSSKGVSSSAYVQVMTMHQSKGLEFDAVILPLLCTKAIDSTEKLKHFVSPGGESILLSPGKPEVRNRYWPGAFESLTAAWQKNRSREAYNLLYVAATRAKRANYLLLHASVLQARKPGEDCGAARSEAGLIRRVFDIDEDTGWSMGDPKWYEDESMNTKDESEVTTVQMPPLALGEAVARRRRVSPSSMAAEPAAASAAGKEKKFITYTLGAAEFGSRVHALFEQLEWLPEGEPLPFAAEEEEAAAEVRAALQVPEVAVLFRPKAGLAVYNEQPMDAVLTKDGEEVWVSAIIDRLVLERTLHTEKQPDGTIIEHEDVSAAHIIDYKTNKRDPKLSAEQQDEALRKEYQGQMSAYRELISAAFGLSADKVSVTLVSVPSDGAPARLVPVPLG